MDPVRMRDLVLIRKKTIVGEKKFAAVVTSIEKILHEETGATEWLIGYEPIDPRFGSSGSSRVPMRGSFGICDIKVLAGNMMTRAERWQP